MRIKKMTLEELVAAEKAATIVRKTYEDKSAMLRGMQVSDGSKEYQEYQELSQKLSTFNAIRLRIIKEMEERLLEIEDNE